MDLDTARSIAEKAHRGQREPDGRLLMEHVRRVVRAAPEWARSVAWLHEVLERTSVPEHELLERGLSGEELRALRLLTRGESRSDLRYLAHVDRIARARGYSAAL